MVESTRAGGPGKHVFVVDDDQVILDVFRALLEDEGYRVSLDALRTGNLDVLYQRVVAERPDLVILDFVILGEKLGWQFLQLLKMQPRTARLPVVICTAAADLVKELSSHLKKMGVGVVLKPFEIDHLYEAIKLSLEGVHGDPWAARPSAAQS